MRYLQALKLYAADWACWMRIVGVRRMFGEHRPRFALALSVSTARMELDAEFAAAHAELVQPADDARALEDHLRLTSNALVTVRRVGVPDA